MLQIIGKISNKSQCDCLSQVEADSQSSVNQPLELESVGSVSNGLHSVGCFVRSPVRTWRGLGGGI